MTKEYDNTNQGAVFVNKRKNTDKHPDYTGSINIEGKEYWLSGWRRHKASDGEMFLSLAATPKEPRQEPRQAPGDRPPSDDVPF